MHSFYFHIGDYAAHTKGLSPEEDIAYRRLMEKYYLDESPIPALELPEIARLIDMRNYEQAVEYVLKRFFSLDDGAYTQKRIDGEIMKYHQNQEETDQKKAAEAERKRRSREERKQLFAEAKQLGIQTSIEWTNHELKFKIDELKSSVRPKDIRQTSQQGDAEVTANHNQKPETNNQLPNNKSEIPKPSRYKYTDDDMKCAKWFFNELQKLQPNRKEPNYESWAQSFRLMREQDDRTFAEIRKLYRWVHADMFWKAQILSPDKLREKFDDLWLKMDVAQAGASQSGENARANQSQIDRLESELAGKRGLLDGANAMGKAELAEKYQNEIEAIKAKIRAIKGDESC